MIVSNSAPNPYKQTDTLLQMVRRGLKRIAIATKHPISRMVGNLLI